MGVYCNIQTGKIQTDLAPFTTLPHMYEMYFENDCFHVHSGNYFQFCQIEI